MGIHQARNADVVREIVMLTNEEVVYIYKKISRALEAENLKHPWVIGTTESNLAHQGGVALVEQMEQRLGAAAAPVTPDEVKRNIVQKVAKREEGAGPDRVPSIIDIELDLSVDSPSTDRIEAEKPKKKKKRRGGKKKKKKKKKKKS